MYSTGHTRSTVQYCTVQYCTVQYCTVLYCTVLCTVLYLPAYLLLFAPPDIGHRGAFAIWHGTGLPWWPCLCTTDFLVRCLEKKQYRGEEQVKRRGSRGSSWFPRWGVRHCDTGGHGQLPSRIKEQCKRNIQLYKRTTNYNTQNIDSSLKRQLLHS